MALLRRRPGTEALSMRDFFDRFFDDALSRSSLFNNELLEVPDVPVDILEEGDKLVVKASIPGIKPEDLHIEVDDDRLRIWAEAKEEKENKEANYHLRERLYGRLERYVKLPYPVNSDTAKAEFNHGVLSLSLPKLGESKRKEIKISAKA